MNFEAHKQESHAKFEKHENDLEYLNANMINLDIL